MPDDRSGFRPSRRRFCPTGLFTDAWGTPPGPLVFAGYATGTIWGRLLDNGPARTAG